MSTIRNLVLLLTMILLSVSPPLRAEGRTPIVIMPIGDSVVRGAACSSNYYGFRHELHCLLNKGSLVHDFVGPCECGINPIPDCGDSDEDHCGYGGVTSTGILDFLRGRVTLNGNQNCYYSYSATNEYPLEQYGPDIVLLHVGGNDIIQGTSPFDDEIETAVNTVRQIINLIRGVGLYSKYGGSGEIDIYVALVVPTTFEEWEVAFHEYVIELENMLYEYISTTGTDNLYVVDIYYPFLLNLNEWMCEDSNDGLHPSEAGYLEVANIFFNAIDANEWHLKRRTLVEDD